MASSRIPGYIYLYTIWEDLQTNPNNFTNQQDFIDQSLKNFEIQKKRDKLFLENLRSLGIPQAPYHISNKDIVLNVFKSKTIQIPQLLIYLVLSETEHTLIKNGELSEFKDYQDILEYISGKKNIMVYTSKV